MKPFPAVALIEFNEIPAGIQATDALLKKSPITFLKNGTITRGRYLTVIGGSTAAVEEAFQEGLYWGMNTVVDKLFLPDVHPELFEAMGGRRRKATGGSWTVIETASASGNVRAAEAVLKSTPVKLLEIRLADDGLAGKGLGIFEGELHDVEAAVETASAFLNRAGIEYSHRILTSPHEALGRQMSASTRFHEVEALNLEGEI